MVRWLAQHWVGPAAVAACATAAAAAAAADGGSAWVGCHLPWCPNTAAAAGQLLHGNPAPTPLPPLGGWGGIGREREQEVGVLSRREGSKTNTQQMFL